jgi:hypothetical protein
VSVEESASSFSGIESVRDRMGEAGGMEDEECMPTKESSGLPSSSGSGREPNLELLDADLPRPVPALKELFGDIMKPAGEYPPDRAAEFTSTIDEALDTCLEITDMDWDNKDDRRLSLRFCSSWRSLIASSIEEVMLNCSAVFSKCSIFPVYAPCSTWRSGVGCRSTLRPEAVRTTGLGGGIIETDEMRGSAEVAGGRLLRGRGN